MSLYACAALGYVMVEFWYVMRCSAGVLATFSIELNIDIATSALFSTPSAAGEQSPVDRFHGHFADKYWLDENYDVYYGFASYAD